jgi:hypothetical protein
MREAGCAWLVAVVLVGLLVVAVWWWADIADVVRAINPPAKCYHRCR